MAGKETKNTPAVATQAALEKINAGEKLDVLEMGSLLENLTPDENQELTSDYLKIEVGEEVRVWLVGMKKIKKIDGEDGEMTDAAEFILDDGSRAINADAVVVSTCKSIEKLPKAMLIQCTGTKGVKPREYKTFKIIALK